GCGRIFLPSQLGWWAVFPFSGVQPERTFPDTIEYLCGKALGYDSGLSLIRGFSPNLYFDSYDSQRLGHIVKDYESLRHAKYFSESIRAKLRELGSEFTLEQTSSDQWQVRPVRYDSHKVDMLDTRSVTWTVNNSFAD